MTDKLDYARYVEAMRKLVGQGGVHVMEVAHDDWCQHWQGKPCNCDPTSRPVT